MNDVCNECAMVWKRSWSFLKVLNYFKIGCIRSESTYIMRNGRVSNINHLQIVKRNGYKSVTVSAMNNATHGVKEATIILIYSHDFVACKNKTTNLVCAAEVDRLDHLRRLLEEITAELEDLEKLCVAEWWCHLPVFRQRPAHVWLQMVNRVVTIHRCIAIPQVAHYHKSEHVSRYKERCTV